MSDDGVTRLIRSRQHDPEVVAELERLRGIVLGAAGALAGPSWSERAAVDEAEMLPSTVRHVVKERDRLRDELDATKPQYEEHIRSLNAALDRFAAKNARLRAVVGELTSFANHAENCAVEADPLGVQKCDCGLELVLDQLDVSGEGT